MDQSNDNRSSDNPSSDNPYVVAVQSGFQRLAKSDFEEVFRLGEKAMLLAPPGPEAMFLLGLAAAQLHDVGHALVMVEEAHKADPECREYVDVMAVLLTRVGRVKESLYYAKLAVAARPHPWLKGLVPPDFANYFQALQEATPSIYARQAFIAFSNRDYKGAKDYAERELRVTPRNPHAHRVLGKALYELGEPERALAALHALAHLEEPSAYDWLAMGDCLMRLGRWREARVALDTALEMEPKSIAMRSRGLVRLAHFPEPDWRNFSSALADWNVHAAAAAEGVAYEIDPGRIHKDRKGLRVGYILEASTFNPLMPFILPLFEYFDTGGFEVVGYQQNPGEDEISNKLRALTDDWREVNEVDDQTLAAIVGGDEIDILVDCFGHGEGNRLGVFAFRPAPVQITLHGPLSGAGAAGIGFAIADAAGEPADADAGGTRLLRCPSGAAAFDAESVFREAPSPAAAPAASGRTTFGATLDLTRLTPETARVIARILKALPDSQLCLGNTTRISAAMERTATDLFSHFGVVDRIFLHEAPLGLPKPAEDYLAHIDIHLDSHPVSSPLEVATALWMGVPAIGWRRNRHATLTGASVLASAGKHDWIATSAEDFIARAVQLGGAPSALAELRSRLRAEVAASALCAPQRFARAVEALYRQAWNEAVDMELRK
jgi:predicted O-linked N-acetylglucosamine transferase (SPINDLY family)